MAWSACNDMQKIRTPNVRLERRLHGTYTRLIMLGQNISWKPLPTLRFTTIFPSVSCIIQNWRVQFTSPVSLFLKKPEKTKRRNLSLMSYRRRQASIKRTLVLQWWTGKMCFDIWDKLINQVGHIQSLRFTSDHKLFGITMSTNYAYYNFVGIWSIKELDPISPQIYCCANT